MLYPDAVGLMQVFQHSIARGTGYPCTSRCSNIETSIIIIMKKTLIALMALAGLAAADVATTPEWITTSTAPGQVTYTFTQTGSFNFADLGDAAIKDGESFSITMEFYAVSNPFLQGNGLSFIAAKNGNADLYDINGNNDQFRFYVRPGDGIVNFSVNGWVYGMGRDARTQLSNTSYTAPAPDSVSAENPVKFGITFTYVNDADAADGNSYFTLAPTADSQFQFAAQTDYNCVCSYNFSDLTNYTGTWTNAPSDIVTTVSITKAGELVPEPTTATLSLLALAGLAARRRRK